MSYKYISVPTNISLEEFSSNNYCLAPSKYTKFIPDKNVDFSSLYDLCSETIKKLKTQKRETYNYTEIGDIDVNTGVVNSLNCFGINMPSENPKELKLNDIVISTVRTYRGGVGFIHSNLEKHCCSPAILVIREVAPSITKEYLFAVLRTDFFIEQILGFQNRGMYPRLDKDAMKHILIPIPKDIKTIKYITLLVKAYLNKMSLIKVRHNAILEIFKQELKSNQKRNEFKFEMPTLFEVKEVGRLDTSRYTYSYKDYEFLIKNYKNGYFKLSDYGYKAKRGQNLQVSNIGQSHYSDSYKDGFYKLAVSSNFSEYSTVEKLTFLGNTKSLTKIQEGDIIFSARGAQFGRVVVFPEKVENTITNIDSLVIQSDKSTLERSIFIAMFLNILRWNKHIYYIAITGSGANSLTQYQSDDINFPEFPDDKQSEIAKLYHNDNITYNVANCTLDNFLQTDTAYNDKAGIYELDKTAKQLKEKLNQAIDDIINDKEVKIKFDN